jgi:hypothetical protein
MKRDWLRTNSQCRAIGALIGVAVLLIGAMSVVTHPKRYASSATLLLVDSMSIEDLERQTNENVPTDGESPMARDRPPVAADTLVRIYEGSAKQRELADAGFVGTLSVSNFVAMHGIIPEHGPILSIAVVGPSPAEAQASAQIVVDDVVEELAHRQRGYDPRLSIHANVTAQPTLGRAQTGSRVRSVLAYTVLAILVSVVVTFGLRRYLAATLRESGVVPVG